LSVGWRGCGDAASAGECVIVFTAFEAADYHFRFRRNNNSRLDFTGNFSNGCFIVSALGTS